jgi:hypothetical protein
MRTIAIGGCAAGEIVEGGDHQTTMVYRPKRMTMHERHELFIHGGLAHAEVEQSVYNQMKFTWNVNGKDRVWYVWADDRTIKDEGDVLAELLNNYRPLVTEGV